jgi:hypothetical protein
MAAIVYIRSRVAFAETGGKTVIWYQNTDENRNVRMTKVSTVIFGLVTGPNGAGALDDGVGSIHVLPSVEVFKFMHHAAGGMYDTAPLSLPCAVCRILSTRCMQVRARKKETHGLCGTARPVFTGSA